MSNTPSSADLADVRHIVRAIRKRHDLFVRVVVTLCIVAVIVGLLDFLLFLAGAFYFGGDAVNGKIEAGKYFLWGYHNGTKGYIEVSQAVFNYSKWHVYSLLVTWPLMFIAAFTVRLIGRRSGR